MNILKLAAMLTLDGTRFKAGLKEAEVGVNRFGKDVLGSLKGEFAAAFGAVALIAFAKKSIETTGAIKDLAEQSHMTTDEVQRLTIAAERMGLSFGDAAAAERQFNQKRKEAVESNEELRDTFAKYGITLDDLQNPQAKFFQMAAKMSAAMKGMSAEDMTRGLTDMADIMGTRVGPRIQELVKQLGATDGLKLTSEEDIIRIDKWGDKLKDIMRAAGHNFAAGITTIPTPENIAKWAMGGKTMSLSPFAMSGAGMVQPASAQPGKMFSNTVESKRAEKLQEDWLKAKNEYERAIMNFGLTKQQVNENNLAEALDEIYDAEADGGPSAFSMGMRKDALGLLSQLASGKPGQLDVASMTKVGQLGGGRAGYVNTTESAIVAEAKKLLGVQKESKTVLEQIRDKRGLTINAKR